MQESSGLSRRKWARLIVAAGLAQMTTAPMAQAQLPDRNLRIVIGYPAGQTTDIFARSFAASLGKELGRSVYVDNKAGANGILGAQEVARAAPDGATLLLGTMSQMAINPSLYRKLPYNPEKDFTPIALVATSAMVLVANPSFPPNNLMELIAYAKERPDKINYASGGIGITGHLAMEILQTRAGIKLNHVPYKGSPPAMNDVIGGQVPVMFDPLATTLPQVKAGRLKALAVSGSGRRQDIGPDVATLDEQGMRGLQIQSWVGFFAPAHMSPELVQRLSAAIKRAAASKDVQNTLRDTGSDSVFVPTSDFSSFLHEEIDKWGKAVKDAKVQID